MSEVFVASLPHGWRLLAQVPEGIPLLSRWGLRLRPHEMLYCGGLYDLYCECRVRERFTKDRSDRSDVMHDPKWKAIFGAWTTFDNLLRMRLKHARDIRGIKALDVTPVAEIERRLLQEVA